jgi:hypothetical protein
MRRFSLVLFFFLLFTLSFFSSGLVESQDGLQYLAVARNIYYKHEPTAPINEYGVEGGWKNIYMSTYVGANGKTFCLTGLGFSLAMVPSVAISDVIYKIYRASPPVHFPLESDWLIFLTTSFINAIFASILGVLLYFYLKEIGIKHKNALIVTLITIFTTNLFAFSKHITAYMMFMTAMFAAFLFLKKYSKTKKVTQLVFSGVFFGVGIITYNNTFMLMVLPYVLYYLLLIKPRFNLLSFKCIWRDIISFLIGVIPFIIIYFWFEHYRAESVALSSASFLTDYAKNRLFNVPSTVFFEGLWGQLFSPGRSFFIYSPFLLLIVIFWFKIKKNILPETIYFIFLATIYIVFYACFYLVGTPQQGFAGMWPGESSWGPRYLSPLIPFGALIAGYIFSQISKFQKIFVVIPLIIIGFYVEILGVLMPYQIKYHYLEKGFFVNNTEYNMYSYVNLLPRYSPIIMQTKNLYRLMTKFTDISFPGKYRVRMYDGINFAFDVGPERWRSIENEGYILFDKIVNDDLKTISFDIINHPIGVGRKPLYLNFILNGKTLNQKPVILEVGKRKYIEFNVNKDQINETDNNLKIIADYKDNLTIKENIQIAGLIDMYINGNKINKEYITVPNISDLGPKMTGVRYLSWGEKYYDPWKVWDIHTQTYERIPDFWWLRNLYYWDVPHKPILTLFVFNIIGILYFSNKLYKMFNSPHKKT